MKRLSVCFAMCLIAIMVLPFGSVTRAQQRSQLGGRPGEFHFILKEQADQNRVAFREMQLRIERMRADITTSATDNATRERMLADLNSFELFVSSMQAQLSAPVGQTAGSVEARLNTIKGQMNCGTCHESSVSRGSE